ncbi:MAG: acyl carrier protein [Burkholderiales bacterium]|nr:acyl carrier protein [Burkholderiales bacterium]
MIAQAVRQFIVTNFYVPKPAELADEQSLLDSGIVDSTGVFELIAFIESTYGFKIKDEEMVPENLDSIAHITTFVSARIA